MDKFWAEAAKVVKPGGTVAVFTRGQLVALSDSQPLLIIFQRHGSVVCSIHEILLQSELLI